MRLLLVHHTPFHFEIVLAAREALAGGHEVAVLSNALDMRGRAGLLRERRIPTHDPGARYDACIVITGDGRWAAEIPAAFSAIMGSTPVVRLLHRYHGGREPGSLHLFGGAPLAFIPADCGMASASMPDNRGRHILVQGRVDQRRDYAILPAMAERAPDLTINVVGKRTRKARPPAGHRIRLHLGLDERPFHEACAANHFCAPLVAPQGSSDSYFSNRFSSSLLMAYSHALPVIAHEALFALYPLHGLAYRDAAGLLACAAEAAAMDGERLAMLRARMVDTGAWLQRRNAEHFEIALAEAGATA